MRSYYNGIVVFVKEEYEFAERRLNKQKLYHELYFVGVRRNTGSDIKEN